MNPYEIMLSESQERMLFIVKAGQEEKLIKIFKRWELDAVAIGEVIEGGNVELLWHEELVSSIPAHLLTSAVPQYEWPTKDPALEPANAELRAPIDLAEIPAPKDLGSAWLSLLAHPNLCSRHAVYNQYDSTVRADTVVHPGSDAGVVRLKSARGREKGIAISLDCNSRFCAIDAVKGAALSLAESCRNIAATGAIPLGISDCLNMPSPENPETMWQIAGSIRGLGEAARQFGVPVVSGNVSLYNQTHGQGIQPTPLLAVVGLLDDVTKAVPSQFRAPGDYVLLLGETREAELGGSAYLAFQHGIERGELPALDYKAEKRACDFVRSLAEKKLINSCHDLSEGGLGVALAECCFRDYEAPLGVTLSLTKKNTRPDAALFAESGARFIISLPAKAVAEVKAAATAAGVPIGGEGIVSGDAIGVDGVASIPSHKAFKAWFNGLDQLFEA
jgi:phosphoribosylformylglycinamidine synthase